MGKPYEYQINFKLYIILDNASDSNLPYFEIFVDVLIENGIAENPELMTRDLFMESQQEYSKHHIVKRFGSFTAFKSAYIEFHNSPKEKSANVSNKEPEITIDHSGAASEELFFGKRYIYNPKEDTYVFLFDNNSDIGKHIVVSGNRMKSILKAYSNYDNKPNTINEIATKFGYSRPVVTHMLRALGITHDSIPMTDPEYVEADTEKTVDELISDKKFAIYQGLQKRSWKETQDSALNWEKFLAGQYNPIVDFLSNWEAPTIVPAPKPSSDAKWKSCDRKNITPIIGLSDLHYGKHAHGSQQFRGTDWGIDDTIAAVSAYADYACGLKDRLNYNIEKVVVIGLGDFLDSITGMTDKGTLLDTHPKGEVQFEAALDSLIGFFYQLLTTYNEVEVHSAQGNHDSFADYVLFRCLELTFKQNQRITFHTTTQRWGTLRVNNSFFLYEHGYSAFYKSKTPASGAPLAAYVQSLLLSRAELLAGVKSRFFLQGDLHSYKSEEYSEFEFIQFSTLSTGDRYADNSNWSSKARQTVLLVGDNDLEGVLHFNYRKEKKK